MKTNSGKEVVLEDQERGVAEEKPYKICAAASFVFIMVFLGVPLWWKTTDVYRASLPYAHISFLSDLPVEIPLSVRFTYFDSETNKSVHAGVEHLAKLLRETRFHEKLEIPFKFYTSEGSNFQKSSLKNAKTFRSLDDHLVRTTHTDSRKELALNVYILPSDFASAERDVICFLGQGTNVYIRDSAQDDSVINVIQKMVLDVYLGTEEIADIIRRALKEGRAETGKREIGRMIWTGSLHPNQVLDYYLINPNPEKCLADQVEFGRIVEDQLKPFYALLEPITKLTVKSQRLFHVELPLAPSFNKEEKFYYFEAHQLPNLINPLERYVTSLEPENPVFHLMVFIAPPEFSPLIILEETGEKSTHNGFAVASWGGLVIFNPTKACNESIEELSDEVVVGMVSQLRILFGMNLHSLPEGFESHPTPASTWQLQRLMLHAVADNLLTAGTTLQSLIRLLSQIRNIVISEEVGGRIQSSVEGLQKAVLSLDARDALGGLEHSKKALLEAEKAFFDPSLLALLYFPDDQKYAIYIPLFLPVGLPVVLSLRFIIKFYRERRKTKTE